jgi:hypothetical protein
MRIVILFLALQSCALPYLLNYNRWKPSRPFDPGKSSKARFHQEKRYPFGNINIMPIYNPKITKDTIEKKDNASSMIVKDFIQSYENIMQFKQEDQKDVPSETSMVKKIFTEQTNKTNFLTKPVSGNVSIIKQLYQMENKIAFPEYMQEYFSLYYEQLKKTPLKTATIIPEREIGDFSNYKGSLRDIYVARQLAWYEVYSMSNNASFTEEKIE